MPTHLKALERWGNLAWAMGVVSIVAGLIGGVVVGGRTEEDRYGDTRLPHLGDGVAVAASGVVVGVLLGLAGNFALAWVAEHERRR